MDVVGEAWLSRDKEVWQVLDPELLSKEEDEELEGDNNCLQITEAHHPWWEKQHWGELLDETKLWCDLSRENQRELTKLKGK